MSGYGHLYTHLCDKLTDRVMESPKDIDKVPTNTIKQQCRVCGKNTTKRYEYSLWHKLERRFTVTDIGYTCIDNNCIVDFRKWLDLRRSRDETVVVNFY